MRQKMLMIFESRFCLHTVKYCFLFHFSLGNAIEHCNGSVSKEVNDIQHRITTSLGKVIQSRFYQTVDSPFPPFLNEPNIPLAWVLFPQTQCSHTPKITLAKDKSESLICTTMVLMFPLTKEPTGRRQHLVQIY